MRNRPAIAAVTCCVVAACSVVAAGVVACGAFSSEAGHGNGDDDAAAPLEGASAVPSGPAVDLVTGQQSPRDIVVDSANVYWLSKAPGTTGTIWSVAKKPNPGPASLFADGGEVSEFAPVSIALTGDVGALYWAGGPHAVVKSKTGGAATQVIWLGEDDTAGDCQGLAVEPGKIYVATSGHGGVVIANGVNGHDNSEITLEQNLGADVKVVTVDVTDVYVGRGGQILKVPKGGSDASAATVFALTDGPVQAIVNDGTAVYWVDASRVRSLAKTSAGAIPADLAVTQYDPSAIAVDDANVYWTNAGDGLVRTVPKTGGAPKTLSTGEGQPMAIAIDAKGLFWTNYADGRVRVIWR